MSHKRILIAGLPFGSLVKIVFLCGAAAWLAMGILAIIASVTVPSALTINGHTATGIGDGLKGFVYFTIAGSIASLLVAAIGAGMLKLIGKFVSFGAIDYFTDEPVHRPND